MVLYKDVFTLNWIFGREFMKGKQPDGGEAPDVPSSLDGAISYVRARLSRRK